MRAASVLAFVFGFFGTACGGAHVLSIERTVGGEKRLGRFVSPHSYEHFVRGELAREHGAWQEAAVHYELARAGAEDDPMLAARLADVRDRLGDREGAERALEEGQRLDPDAEIVWMTRGEIAERHGELEVAIAAYARAVEVAEGNADPAIALARVLRERGLFERAEAVLEACMARAADPIGVARARLALALERSDPLAAGLAALDLVRASPAHAREVADAARALLEMGRPTLAHRMVALLPEHAIPPVLRLQVALSAGAYGEAEALLSRWVPDEPEEMVRAAEAWIELGDLVLAGELAQAGLARGAGSRARLVLARARLEEGRMADAAALAADIPPGDPLRDEALGLLAEALARGGVPALGAEVRAAGREGSICEESPELVGVPRKDRPGPISWAAGAHLERAGRGGRRPQ